MLEKQIRSRSMGSCSGNAISRGCCSHRGKINEWPFTPKNPWCVQVFWYWVRYHSRSCETRKVAFLDQEWDAEIWKSNLTHHWFTVYGNSSTTIHLGSYKKPNQYHKTRHQFSYGSKTLWWASIRKRRYPLRLRRNPNHCVRTKWRENPSRCLYTAQFGHPNHFGKKGEKTWKSSIHTSNTPVLN